MRIHDFFWMQSLIAKSSKRRISMLKIVKASEPMLVERINMCIYSPPGLGKSTLAFTARDPVLLDCDKGAYRAHNRKDTVPVSAWSDIESITAADLAPST